MVFRLDENNRYVRPSIYADEDEIKVGIFSGLTIDLKQVFKKE